MARHHLHKKPSQSPAINPQKKPLPVRLIIAVGLTLLVGGIPFILGKYIELKSPDPFDGGAFVYSAQHLLSGARLWVDEITSAQPGTLLVNLFGVKLFGFSDTGPKLIQMFFQLGGLAMMFYTLHRLFGNAAAAVSTCIAAILLSAPVIAKFGNVKEQFMIPCAIVAACAFALHEYNGKKHWAVLAGAASIIPFYFKPTGIAVIIAIGVFLIVKLIFQRKNWKAVFLTLLLWIGGAILGLCFPASLFVWQKGVGRFFRTFPVVLLEGILLFSFVIFVGFVLFHYITWRKVFSALGTVNQKVWTRGAIGMAVVLVLSITLIGMWRGADSSRDIPDYLQSIPFIRLPMQGYVMLKIQAVKVLTASGILEEGGYVGLSRKAVSYSEQAPKVMRYYNAVGFVTYSALVTLLLAVVLEIYRRVKKQKALSKHHIIAGFLSVWWLVDMALVWVSPHSYEQYYLPPCASGAMLTAYAVWCWNGWFFRSINKIPAVVGAGVCAIVLFALAFPVFAGFTHSPDTGTEYKNYQTGQPERRRGFAQSLAAANTNVTAPWQSLGDYVCAQSSPNDTLYVWGWFPGIYVRAQRMAPVPQAYEANMHVTPPDELTRQIDRLVEGLTKNPPKFIADSRKQHFPFDRPPLELWPVVPEKMFGNAQPQLLDSDPRMIEAFENAYSKMLEQRFDNDEARRFSAMKPFRDFVMSHYRLVRQFGNHMLYERKD